MVKVRIRIILEQIYNYYHEERTFTRKAAFRVSWIIILKNIDIILEHLDRLRLSFFTHRNDTDIEIQDEDFDL